MVKKALMQEASKVLVVDVTFKENCSNIRNSKVINVIDNLLDLNSVVSMNDY